MKALVFTKYGSPESVLQLTEVPEPIPKEEEVLIKVHATAANDWDWSMVRGKPYLYRLMFGIKKPKHQIPGMEMAGVVEAIGSGVLSFKVGDPVYGDTSAYGFGTYAEYVCVNEKALTRKPDRIGFEEAAAISHASMLAMQGFDIGHLQDGQKVLINGAGGGVGTFGLQIAKQHNAEVTGVDTGDKLKMMDSIGYDHIIDYKKEDFTKNGKQYDLILDCKTTRSPIAYLRSLTTNGRYVTVGGHLNRLLHLFFLRPWISLFSSKSVHILALKPNKGLKVINELFESNKIECVLDGPYALEDGPKALQYFGDGKHQGKVVISV